MKVRNQPSISPPSVSRQESTKTVKNDVASQRPSVDLFQKDELVQSRAKPLVNLDPVQTALGVAEGLLPPKYPETPEERTKELERIQQLLVEKADWGASEQGVLDQIGALGVSPIDVWHGSHVVVEDGGALYEQWSQLPGAQPRESSHYGDVEGQQYEIDFPPHGALLFGKDANGNTWFQMENHGGSFDPANPRDYYDGIAHLWDYAVHKGSGNMNVGPFGLSPHSEKEGKQIIVPYVAPDSRGVA